MNKFGLPLDSGEFIPAEELNKIFSEPNQNICPETQRMNITIYTKSNCPNCVAAKQLLKAKDMPFVEIDADAPPVMEWFERDYPGVRQMPQIFINGQRVGGLAGLRVALGQLGQA